MTDSKTELLPCPFCGGEAEIDQYTIKPYASCTKCGCSMPDRHQTAEQAIAAWNTRAELGSGTCAQCAKDMGAYADILCDPLKERINKLLRCLENDWHISASWDGLRKFWNIELTDEGVKLRDATHSTLGSDREKALEALVQKALDEGWCDEWWYEDARKLGLEAVY